MSEKAVSTELIESMLKNLIAGEPMLTNIGTVLDRHFNRPVQWAPRIENGKLYIELEDGVVSTGDDPISRSKRTFVFNPFHTGSGLFG